MKKKLKLNQLDVQSFITTTEKQIKGGAATEPCTIHACRTIPADGCPTTDHKCPTLQVACPTNPVLTCVVIKSSYTACYIDTINCDPIITSSPCYQD